MNEKTKFRIAMIFTIIAAVGEFFFSGVVLCSFWEWFLEPILNFKMTYLHSLGIAALFLFILRNIQKVEIKCNFSEDTVIHFLAKMVVDMFIYLIGAIIFLSM